MKRVIQRSNASADVQYVVVTIIVFLVGVPTSQRIPVNIPDGAVLALPWPSIDVLSSISSLVEAFQASQGIPDGSPEPRIQ